MEENSVKNQDVIPIEQFIELANKHNIFEKKGPWYKYCGTSIGRNQEEISNYMNKNELILREVSSLIAEKEGWNIYEEHEVETEESEDADVELKTILPVVEMYPDEEVIPDVELALMDLPDSEVIDQYFEEIKDIQGAIKRPKAIRKWLSIFYSTAYQRIGGDDCSTENLYRLALQHKDMIPNDDYIIKYHGQFETTMEINRFLSYVCIMRIDELEEREQIYDFYKRVETGIALPIFMPPQYFKRNGQIDFDKFREEADINEVKAICYALRIGTHKLEGGSGNASRDDLIDALEDATRHKTSIRLDARSKFTLKAENVKEKDEAEKDSN